MEGIFSPIGVLPTSIQFRARTATSGSLRNSQIPNKHRAADSGGHVASEGLLHDQQQNAPKMKRFETLKNIVKFAIG